MGKGNAFLNKLANQRDFDDAVVRAVTQQWVLDMVTIALGRLGWARSEIRMGQFDTMMQAVTKEFAELAEDERQEENTTKRRSLRTSRPSSTTSSRSSSAISLSLTSKGTHSERTSC